MNTETNWRHLSSAPKDGTIIEGLYESGPCLVRWAEHRQCMLAGIGGGNGYFGPGWEDEENHLIVDEPMAWREESGNDYEQELMERIGTLEAVVSQFMEIIDEPDLDHEYREALQDICGLRNPTLDDGIEAVSAAFKSVDQSRKFDDK